MLTAVKSPTMRCAPSGKSSSEGSHLFLPFQAIVIDEAIANRDATVFASNSMLFSMTHRMRSVVKIELLNVNLMAVRIIKVCHPTDVLIFFLVERGSFGFC
jgi:hypothetical protein